MNVESFIGALDRGLDFGNADAALMRRARDHLQQALGDESFLADCLDRSLDELSRTLSNPCVFEAPDRGIDVRMVFWPPRFENAPHMHQTWTLTGVLHNIVEIRTYHATDLTVQQLYLGRKGSAGYLLAPCMHNVRNPSHETSVSLHVFSQAKQLQPLAPSCETLTQVPATDSLDYSGTRKLTLMALIDLATQTSGVVAPHLLNKVFALGDRGVKLQAIKAMSGFDLEETSDRIRELLLITSGEDHAHLKHIWLKLSR